ncbi:hypothetical protein D3C74_352450 [compost metagenome]
MASSIATRAELARRLSSSVGSWESSSASSVPPCRAAVPRRLRRIERTTKKPAIASRPTTSAISQPDPPDDDEPVASVRSVSAATIADCAHSSWLSWSSTAAWTLSSEASESPMLLSAERS